MSNIPKSFQDYYDDDPDIDRRQNRWDYWAGLKKARIEYMEKLNVLDGQFDAYEFEEYLEQHYGIKMNLVNGNITDGFKIMDEKKYLVFLLKFQ